MSLCLLCALIGGVRTVPQAGCPKSVHCGQQWIQDWTGTRAEGAFFKVAWVDPLAPDKVRLLAVALGYYITGKQELVKIIGLF